MKLLLGDSSDFPSRNSCVFASVQEYIRGILPRRQSARREQICGANFLNMDEK